MQLSEKNYKRIVVKVGSSLLFSKDAAVYAVIEDFISQVSLLCREKKEVVIVSSGAIAFGMHKLGLKNRPKELSGLQAAAAVGQHFLMSEYQLFFKKQGLDCAQILLTYDDFDNRKRYLNAKNTLLTLFSMGVVPVVNENDTISSDEIKFGDNDKLSSLVATLINADLLVILSDVDGLWDEHKKVIRIVDEITPQIKSLACPTDKQRCVGGMITKIEAAKIATDSGIPCVIANGNKRGMLLAAIAEPIKNGTLFVSKKSLDAKERWIAFGTKPKGAIIVDQGAKLALLNKKSLLCVGVTSVEGIFEAGDIVSVKDQNDLEFARGKVNLTFKQLDKVKGERFGKEVIHRDNIVIL